MTPEELELFYHIAGKAIWHLQYVEESLGHLFLYKAVLVKPNSVKEGKANEELIKVQKKPLGQLIADIERTEIISSELLERLKTFNQKRKWLVHKSLVEDGDNLYSSSGRLNVFKKIEDFTNEAILLQKEIAKEISRYSILIGLPIEQLEEKAKNKLNKLKGRA
jgi:hypothetical protein